MNEPIVTDDAAASKENTDKLLGELIAELRGIREELGTLKSIRTALYGIDESLGGDRR